MPYRLTVSLFNFLDLLSEFYDLHSYNLIADLGDVLHKAQKPSNPLSWRPLPSRAHPNISHNHNSLLSEFKEVLEMSDFDKNCQFKFYEILW
jgi:hypothetical protein